MHSMFWQLGGPARFAATVADELREGSNVVLRLPEHVPRGLAGAVRTAIDDSGGWSWHTISLCREPTGLPAQYLARRVIPEIGPTAILDAGDLVNEEAFSGRLFWVEDMQTDDWPAWRDFLAEYSHACRSRSVLDRTLLCVSLTGISEDSVPAADICLACHTWRGVVDSLDMLLYCSNLLRDGGMPSVRRRLLASIMASLALWDPTVAERLAVAGMDEILEPHDILKGIACERGWTADFVRDEEHRWAHGAMDLFDGEDRIHSAALMLHDPNNEFLRRIWNAEIGILLPFVEERRQALLRRLAGILKVPFRTRFGELITDSRELEIGHIESQVLTNDLPVSPDVRRLIRQLREIRNCLAHQEVVPKRQLLGEILDDP